MPDDASKTTITLDEPDDFHHHLRDGAVLADTSIACALQFGRAICMPNLVPPVTTVALAQAYKQRILHGLGTRDFELAASFQPLMTMYLTDDTTPEMIDAAAASGDVTAVKLYPAGATTNSASGVTDYAKITPALEAMARHKMPLLMHGEVTDSKVDVFDRERVFVETKLPELLKRTQGTGLKMVLEHMTCKEAAEVVLSGEHPNVGATITPQHLLANRNDMLVGGIKPHLYCLPILKTELDRQALLKAVASGCERIFLGTDSAPHPRGKKESSCGCAGVFTAHAALELYAEAFEEAGALDKLPAFASKFGHQFYGLPPPASKRVTLVKQPWKVPDYMPFGDEVVVPYRAGGMISWRREREGGVVPYRAEATPCISCNAVPVD